MKLTDLIQELTTADIRLWLEQGQLRFSAPAGAMSTQRREMIKAHKGDIIRFLSNANQINIQAHQDSDHHQLSYAQERLWSAERLHGPSGLYNEGHALCIHGKIDIKALEKSLQFVVDRHDILRAYIEEADEQAYLGIQEEISVVLELSDFQCPSTTLEARQQAALELLSDESQKAFNLLKAPLFRFPLVRIAEDQHALGVFIHHILCDGLSARIFFNELSLAYESYIQGKEPNLPKLSVQYTDYSLWQKEHLDQLSIQRDVAYWRRQLKNIQPLDIGDKSARSKSNTGRVHRFEIPGHLMRQVDQLAKRVGVTKYTLFASVYQILLSAMSGRSDICFTTPVTERQHNKLQQMIGLFVNSVTLRQEVHNIMSFSDFVANTKAHVNEAFCHNLAPIEKVKEVLSGDDVNRREVSEVLNAARFVYLEDVPRELKFHDLHVEPFTVGRNQAKFDFMLTLERDGVDDGTACHCNIEYKVELFTDAYVKAVTHCFLQMLEEVVTKPYRSVGEVKRRALDELEQWKGRQKALLKVQRRESLKLVPRRAVS